MPNNPINEMPRAKYVTGFSDSLDWRPINFMDLPPFRSCHVCGVVPNETFLLECSHSFCKSCYRRILQGGTCCPLDREAIDESDVRNVVLKKERLEKLSAACHNRVNGCGFVGGAEQVVLHYLTECEFHTVTCSKCNALVLRSEMLEHYVARCEASAPQRCFASPTAENDLVSSVLKASKEIEQALSDISERQASLQDRVNTLIVGVSTTQQTVMSMEVALRDSLGALLQNQDGVQAEQDDVSRRNSQYLETIRRSSVDRNEFRCDQEATNIVPCVDESVRPSPASSYVNEAVENLRIPVSSYGGLRYLVSGVCSISRRLGVVEGKICELLSVTQSESNMAVCHIKDFAVLKAQAEERGFAERASDVFVVGGYAAKIDVCFRVTNATMFMELYFTICQSANDSRLKWPFTKSYSLILVHPLDEKRSIEKMVTIQGRLEKISMCFVRPTSATNHGRGFPQFCKVKEMEKGGFICDDAFCVAFKYK